MLCFNKCARTHRLKILNPVTLIMPVVSVADIQPQLLTLAARRAGREVADIDPKASIQDLGIDSLGLAEFLFDVDDEFGVAIGEEELKTARCLDDLAALIARMSAERAGQA